MKYARVVTELSLGIVVTVLVLLSPSLRAQQQSSVYIHGGKSESLVEDCGKTGAYCIGYILGVVDMHNALNAVLASPKDNTYCVPDNASATQLAKVITKYGNDHPEELNEAALVMVSNAFIRAFPCK